MRVVVNTAMVLVIGVPVLWWMGTRSEWILAQLHLLSRGVDTAVFMLVILVLTFKKIEWIWQRLRPWGGAP